MRITGLATGLDMDQIVKDSMKPYRVKIDRKGQDKEILEIKQKLYREVIKDSREFYNKYFDVTKSDSLLLSKNWATTKFTSSNENVITVTGNSDAKPGSYTITGTTAKAAKTVLTTGINKDDKININGKEFKLNGDTEKDRAENLNKELREAGINVSVRYSDFAGTEEGEEKNKKGFIFESTVLGKDSTFTIGGTFNNEGIVNKGINATAATVTGSDFTINALKATGGKIFIKGEEITIDIDDTLLYSDIEKLLQIKIKDKNLTAEVDDNGKITFSSTVLGSGVDDPEIFINGQGGAFEKGVDATSTTNTLDINSIKDRKISVNGNMIDLTGKNDSNDILNHLNKVLKDQNTNVTASINAGGNIVITSNKLGADYDVNVSVMDKDKSLGNAIEPSVGKDAEIVFKDSKGGVYTHTGNSNLVTLDGVTFKFSGEIPSEGITVNGKTKVTDIKDKLVTFINDYNTLIEKLNTLTMEKRNRDFDPLTSEQKSEMSESEVKLWNEKVEKGQLNRDSDLTRISNSLKQAMRTFVEGSGLNLEKIGIKPTEDYQGTKNGTFTIDEDKLTKALEENTEEVMNLFIKAKPTTEGLSDSKKYAQTGLMQRVKDILYKESVTVSSPLMNKAGLEGSSTAYTNELTKSIEKYEQKMKDMEKDFSRREQALYSKYATLETIMNKYNSQQSYLMQQLGMN
ncbi:flagellar filament capping protein FliD [Clostridium sp.]|uniref:flagellar filament capping protein FliD n=1 Tax=Clostridium sp. TaxID=1506 RepID=UPI0025B8AD5B|nr:flagellar filament capping protein FliD [Clostridium sp.]